MTDTAIYQNHPPALIPLYARALRAKSGQKDSSIIIPELSASLIGASTSTKSLARYQSICNFRPARRIPVTWPHILAFPLHLKLLTDNRFPLPLLGLVHLRNTITQHREIACGENLDIRVRFGQQESTSRGIEFDLITEAYSAGKLVWEESSVNLFRQARNTSDTPEQKNSPPKLERYPNTINIHAAESIGRQYASVSGDRNPIHLHALTAKAFGFPRAIAHGMWSKAHALALLEQQENWKAGAFRVSCQFKKPLFLPGTAQLNWRAGESEWNYQLLNAQGDAPHLTGSVEWL